MLIYYSIDNFPNGKYSVVLPYALVDRYRLSGESVLHIIKLAWLHVHGNPMVGGLGSSGVFSLRGVILGGVRKGMNFK